MYCSLQNIQTILLIDTTSPGSCSSDAQISQVMHYITVSDYMQTHAARPHNGCIYFCYYAVWEWQLDTAMWENNRPAYFTYFTISAPYDSFFVERLSVLVLSWTSLPSAHFSVASYPQTKATAEGGSVVQVFGAQVEAVG